MKDTFLRLISPFPFDRLPAITETDLAEIKSSALKHNLLVLVLSRINKLKGSFAGNAAVERFLEEARGAYLNAVSVSMRQEAEEKRILDALSLADLPALVIKGNALAREIYGDPNCRSSSDSDILIRKGDAFIADRIVQSLGYVPESGLPLEYCIHRLHAAPYHKKTGTGAVEMHWNFTMPFFFNLTSEEIWEGVVSSGQGAYQLSPEMTVISLLIHHHTHSFREMRILVDILWTMHKYDDVIDWRSIVIRLKSIGLLKTAYITLSQLNGLWKESVKDMLSVAMLSDGLAQAGFKKPVMLSRYFAPEKMTPEDIYKDRLVARFALDRRSNVVNSVTRTLFPVPQAIKGLYNEERRWMLPYNYARYLSWRLKDWTGGK